MLIPCMFVHAGLATWLADSLTIGRTLQQHLEFLNTFMRPPLEARATSCALPPRAQHQNTWFSNTYILTTIIAIYIKI